MLTKVEITNFLSIKDTVTIKFNKDITSLIGKNEAGKSCVLKAIKKLNGEKIEKKEKNVTIKNQPSSIKGIFKVSLSEVQKINEEYSENDNNVNEIYLLPEDYEDLYYSITVNDTDNRKWFSLYYMKDGSLVSISKDIFRKKINQKIEEIVEEYRENITEEEKNLILKLLDEDDENAIKEEYNKLNITNEDLKTDLGVLINELEKNKWISLLPKYKFVYFNSFTDVLNDDILVGDIESSTQTQNILKIGEIDIESLVNSCEENEQGELSSIENKYIDVVTRKFRTIFKQVDPNFSLKIRVDTRDKKILFFTHDKTSTQTPIAISQRSDGFRWYLSIYLTLYEYIEKKTNDNYVLLIDEPNLYLHATAQKDLLERIFKEEFNDIQILYSTHSPYMIDGDNLFSIRVIEKDEQTKIYNNPQEYIKNQIKNKGNGFEVDTITPLLTSLELSVSTNVTFSSNDKILLVEGVQDVYVLRTFVKLFCLEERFNNIKIIGCYGATKLSYMYSYLVGMGYETYILVDDDDAGRTAISELSLDELDCEKLFLKYSKTGNKGNDCTLEKLFSDKDEEIYFSEKSTILSKRIYDNWDEYKFSSETKRNFARMLKIIIKIIDPDDQNEGITIEEIIEEASSKS